MKNLLKKFGLIICIFFLLIFIEISILQLKEEISIVKLLEIGSLALFVILYYFIVRTEVRIASRVIKNELMLVEEKFERIEKKFEEEVKVLKELLKKDSKRSKK